MNETAKTPMKDHNGCKRGFNRSSKAWYADAVGGNQSVSFGMYHEDGGTSGEMSVEWVPLSNKAAPQLRSFDDSWSALALFSDLISEMGLLDDRNITEEQFVDVLLRCEFNDMTQYTNPDRNSQRSKKFREIERLEKKLADIRDSF